MSGMSCPLRLQKYTAARLEHDTRGHSPSSAEHVLPSRVPVLEVAPAVDEVLALLNVGRDGRCEGEEAEEKELRRVRRDAVKCW